MSTTATPTPASPAVNTEAELKAQGMSPDDIASVRPLLSNNSFRPQAEAHILAARVAAERAAAAASMYSDYLTTISRFRTLVTTAKALAKDYPETAKQMESVTAAANEAMAQLGNPVAPVKSVLPAIPAPVAPAPAPVPAPVTPVAPATPVRP